MEMGNLSTWIFSPSFAAPIEKKASLSLQIGRGLDFLHHRGIIHRDLKFANILLNTCYDAKIGDLGAGSASFVVQSSTGTCFLQALQYKVVLGRALCKLCGTK